MRRSEVHILASSAQLKAFLLWPRQECSVEMPPTLRHNLRVPKRKALKTLSEDRSTSGVVLASSREPREDAWNGFEVYVRSIYETSWSAFKRHLMFFLEGMAPSTTRATCRGLTTEHSCNTRLTPFGAGLMNQTLDSKVGEMKKERVRLFS